MRLAALTVLRGAGLAGDVDALDLGALVPVPSSTTASIIRVSCAATSGVTACESSCGSADSMTDRSEPMTDSTR